MFLSHEFRAHFGLKWPGPSSLSQAQGLFVSALWHRTLLGQLVGKAPPEGVVCESVGEAFVCKIGICDTLTPT